MTSKLPQGLFQYLHDMEHHVTEAIELAARFVNRTNRNLFLTGKAGTGKTTFLQTLAETTHKRFVVVAPTGIAALNAKGVTIHSQFLLPPGTFIPDDSVRGELPNDYLVYTPRDMVRKHTLNKKRKQVLRAIDLLIIDEVSMVRADLLDAIDQRLKFVKRNYREPFGGVQVLMIGDLFQLPPVVKEREWGLLSRYYPTPYFFEAQALKNGAFTYLELDKIFRQSDQEFVRLLNNLRNNCPTKEDIELLNAHYRADAHTRKGEEVITLTTHNRTAEALNERALKQLSAKAHEFRAVIEGDFPPSMQPVNETITLKEGAQIMFVKNDMEGKYFNGKLATVVKIDEDEKVLVELAESKERLVLKRELWENKRYELHEATKEMEELVLGSFFQYPIKLAWAITIHKSQGLTFERAIIDVGEAFAPGQVYVALSRLRSLDGLTLRTRIHPGVITTDLDVVRFSDEQPPKEVLPEELSRSQGQYLERQLHQSFDFDELLKELGRLEEKHEGKLSFGEADLDETIGDLFSALRDQMQNLAVFRHQVSRLIREADGAALLDRLTKAKAYYDTILRKSMQRLLNYLQAVKKVQRTKAYSNDLDDFDQLLSAKRDAIARSAYLAQCILENRPIEKEGLPTAALKEDRALMLLEADQRVMGIQGKTKRRTAKTTQADGKASDGPKLSTYEETMKRFSAGMDIKAIAEDRGLKPSTIESHLLQGVRDGEVPLEVLVPEEDQSVIAEALRSLEGDGGLKEVFAKLNKRYSYTQLNAVRSVMESQDADA